MIAADLGPLQGRILMTHPTKAITHTLLRDFVKVSRGSTDEGLYSEKDLEATLERTEVMDFHQTVDLDGIRVRDAICFPGLLTFPDSSCAAVQPGTVSAPLPGPSTVLNTR